MSAPELKPCPFCGENLIVHGSPITRDIKKVSHPSNDCILSSHNWWHVPRFIGPWNTRAALSAALEAERASHTATLKDAQDECARAEAAEAERDTLKSENARLREALFECQEEIDAYIQHEYPHDHPVQERYRQRDYAANPARAALQKENKA
jgi:hypothetical protein